MPLESWAATKHQSLGQVLSSLIESDPAIQSRLLKAKMRGKIVGWPLATFNPRLPIIANRVALIGDAAGLINPISGEGSQGKEFNTPCEARAGARRHCSTPFPATPCQFSDCRHSPCV